MHTRCVCALPVQRAPCFVESCGKMTCVTHVRMVGILLGGWPCWVRGSIECRGAWVWTTGEVCLFNAYNAFALLQHMLSYLTRQALDDGCSLRERDPCRAWSCSSVHQLSLGLPHVHSPRAQVVPGSGIHPAKTLSSACMSLSGFVPGSRRAEAQAVGGVRAAHKGCCVGQTPLSPSAPGLKI